MSTFHSFAGSHKQRQRAGAAFALFALTAVAALAPALAQNVSPQGSGSPPARKDIRRFVPTTISEGWRQIYEGSKDPVQAVILPAPDDLKAWAVIQQVREEAALPAAEKNVERYGVKVQAKNFGGVPALEIVPKGYKDNGKVLLYAHGGAYTLFSARSTLGNSALVATHTGLRVISVDYTTAPKGKWQEVIGQTATVFKELNKQGVAMKDIAIYGDSAGGAIAAGAILKLRDEGHAMPAAAVLWSPWADITETGDTYQTLRDADPNYIYERVLGPSADAYADKKDQKHPYVSPVYGDYKKGFPPTLIQGGTREILLSCFVRLYRALDSAGQNVTLDIYEGMPHVFQTRLPESPEAVTALKKMDAFLGMYLKK